MKKVILDKVERKVIDRMLSEKKAGRSIRLITEGLNKDSISSATGTSWHYSSVKDIVKRELAVDHYENGGENELTEAMEAILESKELEMA